MFNSRSFHKYESKFGVEEQTHKKSGDTRALTWVVDYSQTFECTDNAAESMSLFWEEKSHWQTEWDTSSFHVDGDASVSNVVMSVGKSSQSLNGVAHDEPYNTCATYDKKSDVSEDSTEVVNGKFASATHVHQYDSMCTQQCPGKHGLENFVGAWESKILVDSEDRNVGKTVAVAIQFVLIGYGSNSQYGGSITARPGSNRLSEPHEQVNVCSRWQGQKEMAAAYYSAAKGITDEQATWVSYEKVVDQNVSSVVAKVWTQEAKRHVGKRHRGSD